MHRSKPARLPRVVVTLVERSVRAMAVVVAEVLGEDGFRVAATKTRSRSRHSRRTVPTKRSAMAFARGARTGVLMVLMPSAAKTASKEDVNLVSGLGLRTSPASGDRRSAAEVPGLLGHPGAGGVGRDTSEVNDPGVKLDEEQDVETAEQHRIHAEEVTRDQSFRLEPGRTRPTWDPNASGRARCRGGAGSPTRSRVRVGCPIR